MHMHQLHESRMKFHINHIWNSGTWQGICLARMQDQWVVALMMMMMLSNEERLLFLLLLKGGFLNPHLHWSKEIQLITKPIVL